MKKVLITGIAGQDGSYLAEFLLEKGYEVYGVVRPQSLVDTGKLANISHILNKLQLITINLQDINEVKECFTSLKPDECYHLAASSFVSFELEDDLSIMNNNFMTTYNILYSVIKGCPNCRVYFAGSSEIFGDVNTFPQNEETKFNPRSMYGISKLAAHHLINNYRKQYGIFAVTGFTYNHESPRRGLDFVTRKITKGVAQIYAGRRKTIELGNLDAVRDWGYAPDYVEAMWLMLQNNIPKDYVISTGVLHSIKDLLQVAFGVVGLDWERYVQTKREFVRPKENVFLVGDNESIFRDLGWKPRKMFNEIIREMVLNDILLESKE